MKLRLKKLNATVRTVISKSEAIEYFTNAAKKPYTAFDYETGGRQLGDGLSWERGHIIGTSFCCALDDAVYLPWKHRSGNAEAGAIDVMAEFMREAPLVAHNFPFEYGWTLHHLGFKPTMFADTMLVVATYDSNLPRKLKEVVKAYFGHQMQTFDDVTKKTKDFTRVPVEDGFYYGCSDSLWTYRLIQDIAPKIQLDKGKSSIYKLENNLAPLICDMHYNGIKIDTQLLQEYSIIMTKNVADLENEIYHLIQLALPELATQSTLFGGFTVSLNLNSPPDIQKLFSKLGFDLSESGTGVKVLQELDHPIARKILEYRQEGKILSTYITPYYSKIEKDNLMHQGIIQYSCGSGRLAGAKPNLMAVPKIRD